MVDLHPPSCCSLLFIEGNISIMSFIFSESSDGIRRTSELGIQCGYQRRNKELLNWVRKMRHQIRREDLLSYLAGKPPPPRTHHR